MSLTSATATAADTSAVHPPLDLPNPSPKIGINDPEFETLTTAEKLNDRSYRELVYETYPNEPTCACGPVVHDSTDRASKDWSDMRQSSSGFLVCKSGCKKACCSGVRQSGDGFAIRDDANKDDKLPPPFMPSHCVGNLRYSEYVRCNVYDEDEERKADNGGYCDGVNRLRGGGEGGERRDENERYPQSERVNEAMPRRSDDAWNGTNGCRFDRLGGGGVGVGYEYAERHPINRRPGPGTSTHCYMEENPPRETCMEQPQDSHLVNRRPGPGTSTHCYTEENPLRETCMEQPQDSHLVNRRPGPGTSTHCYMEENLPRGPYMKQSQDSHLETRNLHRSACAPRLPHPSVPAGCCCPGKEKLASTRQQGANAGACGRKPCAGVDCLIKAFHETQEFVESLGRVPGLAGLGLMDPAESPYFGRDKSREGHHEGTKATTTFPDSSALPNPQCVGPCNPRTLKSTLGGSGEPVAAAPFTIAVPGRGGVVREAVPAMPGADFAYSPGKARRREEKDRTKETEVSSSPVDVETGPCGEPACRAKRRTKEATEEAPAEEAPAKKLAGLAGANGARNSGGRRGSGMKRRSVNGSSLQGAGGDGIGRKGSSGRSVRRATRFVYSAGDEYTGPTCGHKNCIEERHRVPGNMGWLWNLNETVGRLKPRPGWRPGAIARHVSEILREAKRLDGRRSRTRSRSSSSRSRSRSAPSRGKRTKVHKDARSVKKSQRRRKEEEKEEIEPPPTLHINRKDGTYYVTMYPIKQDRMEVPKLEEPMKPLQFKIAKRNRDEASVASSSTASDMEIEFSPPAAVNRYHKKPDVVHVETQVRLQEITDAFRGDRDKKTDKKKGKKGKK